MASSGLRRAAVGSVLFFVLAPGTVAGLVPWWLTGYRLAAAPLWLLALRFVFGGLLVLGAVAVLLRAFVRFVHEGRGTPAPPAPTERLVVGGDYRYVRNPMYVAVVACVLGQAALLGSLRLVGYGVAVWAVMAAFVRWYEEPTLLARFGPDYLAYRQAVPAWVPRHQPWTPTG